MSGQDHEASISPCTDVPFFNAVFGVASGEPGRQAQNAWESVKSSPEHFAPFFTQACRLLQHGILFMNEKAIVLQFLINCYRSLEQPFVRETVLKLTHLPCWTHLNPLHCAELIKRLPKGKKHWKNITKKYTPSDDTPLTPWQILERDFFSDILDHFLEFVSAPPDVLDKETLAYIERLVELVIDLLSQLPTRKLFRPLLVNKHFVPRCQLSPIMQNEDAKLFKQKIAILKFYEGFEIDDFRGEALSPHEVEKLHYKKHELMRQVAWHDIPELRDLALSNVSAYDKREAILKVLKPLPIATICDFCAKVIFLDVEKDATLRNMLQKLKNAQELAVAQEEEKDNGTEKKKKKKKKKTAKLPEEEELRTLLLEIVVDRLERRKSQREDIDSMPLFPTEEILWDRNLVPGERYDDEFSLALPKLNLQFLTIHDYLLRNFHLFRSESSYSIRSDLQDIIARMQCIQEEGKIEFKGHARMALPVTGFGVVNVKKPFVGEVIPSEVRGEVSFSLNGIGPVARAEWDAMREHDIIFLVSLQPPETPFRGNLEELEIEHWREAFGIKYVRGAEVLELVDEDGNILSETNPRDKKTPVGDQRTLRVSLDAAQYQLDLESVAAGSTIGEVYETFNLMMRRRPAENNFKAVLATIRDLMDSSDVVIPDWLHDLFLGFGDPGAARYWKMPDQLKEIDFRDTFIDRDHVLESFPDAEDIHVDDNMEPPFKLSFEQEPQKGCERPLETVRASTYFVKIPGPYPFCIPNRNKVRFTPVQVEAIRSGVNPGLTMVVGPPGTGKTDTAVQMVNLLFHNFPDQKFILIAHSNQALNDLFEKIIQLDIPERYLLRLGRGIDELDSEKDFSKWGRVNYMLQRRIDLLADVKRLADSFGLSGEDASYTCETAKHFFLRVVEAAWEEYQQKLKIAGKEGVNLHKVVKRPVKPPTVPRKPKRIKFVKPKEDLEMEFDSDSEKEARIEEVVVEEINEETHAKNLLKNGSVVNILFPFAAFFADVENLFPGSYDKDWDVAEGCMAYLRNMFKEIEECRAFELLRNQFDRTNYLVTTHARIIAMTCTHAALQRRNLVNLAFKYDNVLMEESAQILEVETFIPLLLQKVDQASNKSRLKRVILIGDHHQLPPVVKNRAIQRYCHFDQSLFTRFVRLNTPTIDLNMQGRTRPSIAKLYNWRYNNLGDLTNVLVAPKYLTANAGFAYDYQFIDVPDYQGKGESQPQPFYFQNLGEAEMVVAMFMYMRIMGYPAEKITILSTYNGQKDLIKDVLRQRCGWNPLFGEPLKVTTVDKYQGQQNDYVLVSLVRTANVGHIRDMRRLVVTLSRAKLGLYVCGRWSLFIQCSDLQTVMNIFRQRPQKLALHAAEESYPTDRMLDESVAVQISDVQELWDVVQRKMEKRFQAAVESKSREPLM
eukprot:GEMP01003441.1.p1 GENE.GEMP01003441.1~~GEMP01003441.1.p1  ORF type:complete len:1407 (+),score=338.32 GEMP01003441.1:43-4263(+)